MFNRSCKPLILLIFCIVLPLVVGALGSFFTLPQIPGWYATLVKPWFSPPGWIFGPVWTVLYILMGISLWLVIRNGYDEREVRQGILVFGAQLLVNLLWSVFFFGFQSPAGGLVVILVLLVLIMLNILQFRKVSVQAAYLLIPYFGWTCFATILNSAIVFLN